MINVDPKIKAAFQADNVKKYWSLQFPEVVNTETGEVEKPEKIFKNANIASDSLTLTEPMCSEEQLTYGQCEAATFEIEIEYSDESLVGRVFNVFLVLGDYSEPQYVFTVGRYVVDTEEISAERYTKTITAYDIMYALKALDVTAWYYEVQFPISIKDFRDSLFEYVNQEQETKNSDGTDLVLVNDHMMLTNSPLDGETEILFETLIVAICEWNGSFGHINRNGKFDYKRLTADYTNEVYPAKDLYPSHDLFPYSARSTNYYIDPHLIKSDIEWQNYMCKTVDTVQARGKSGRVAGQYHIPEKTTYTNIYVIQDNWLTDAFTSEDLAIALINFGEFIKMITYKPCKANIKMDLSYEVGDAITLTGFDGTLIPTFILNRTTTGIMHAFDEIEATGYEEWVNESPSMDGAVSEMLDELNDLSDRVDALESGEDQGISIISVEKLPEAPKKNVLYLVQGKIAVY